MIQNFPNLRKNTNLHIGEPQIGSMQRNSLISILIMIDMLKPKKKILKQQVIIYEGSQWGWQLMSVQKQWRPKTVRWH